MSERQWGRALYFWKTSYHSKSELFYRMLVLINTLLDLHIKLSY